MPSGAGHGLMPLLWCFVILRLRWIALSSPGGCYMASMFAIRCENAMESGQVHSWLRYQGGQFANKIKRLKDHVNGASFRCKVF